MAVFDPMRRPELHAKFLESLARALAHEDARYAAHVAWVKALELPDVDEDGRITRRRDEAREP
jgi:hypothetical protein